LTKRSIKNVQQVKHRQEQTNKRKNINDGTGIRLLAIIGPEVPIPITPMAKSGISLPVGSLVWS